MPLQSIKLVLKEFYAQYEFDEVWKEKRSW